MKLILDDKRSLQLPDDMPDETARQLKALILALEQRAVAAESEARLLRDEMAQVRTTVNTATIDNTATVAAIQRMHGELLRALGDLRAVAAADRMMVPDPITNDMTRSRVVL